MILSLAYVLGYAALQTTCLYLLWHDAPARGMAGVALGLVLYLFAGVIWRRTRWLASGLTLISAGIVAWLVRSHT